MKQKMKNLQSLVIVAQCINFAMGFVSCGKDDEPEKPKVEKRMTSLEDNYRVSFVYDDGKIVKEQHGSSQYEIKYHDSYISIEWQASGDYPGEIDTYHATYYLNNGLVIKYVESDGWYQEFTYEDGRIKTWKKYDGDGTLDEDISFEWKDGVITRQTKYRYHNNKAGELICDYQYSYTNDPDYGGAVVCFRGDSRFYTGLDRALIIQGYFGKLPKYLVSGIIDASGYFKGFQSYTYTLDSDGYPLTMGGTEGVKFTWENLK